MSNIPAVSNMFSALNPSKLIKLKMDNLINGVNALNKQSGVPKGGVDRIDKQKHGDDQAGRFERFERIFAAHTRAHAVNEMASHLMSKKDTNGALVC